MHRRGVQGRAGEKDWETTIAKCPLRNSSTVLGALQDTKTQHIPVSRGHRAVVQNTERLMPSE